MAEDVHHHMAKRIRQVAAYSWPTTEGDSMSDMEEQPALRRRRPLKSGSHWTRATTVLNKMTWPYEVVYTSAGKPATYQDISIPLLIQGYLITMDSEEGPVRQKMTTNLKELMSDVELYGWDRVTNFHVVWLSQLEQGCYKRMAE